MVRAGGVAVLQLGLGDRGLVDDVPQGRGLGLVRLPAGQVTQERALAGGQRSVADRRVEPGPVDRQAEPAPQRLEDLHVGLDQPLAQLDEVAPADRLLLLRVGLLRWREVGVVRQRRVAADAEEGLHPPLGRQAVVVPAHRIEHRLAAHALVARDQVGVGVAEDMADVQAAGHGRRRRVDAVDVRALVAAVEGVRALVLPAAGPGGLETLEARLVGDADLLDVGGVLLTAHGFTFVGWGRARRGVTCVRRAGRWARSAEGALRGAWLLASAEGRCPWRQSMPGIVGACPRTRPMPRSSGICWAGGPRPGSTRPSTASAPCVTCSATRSTGMPSCTSPGPTARRRPAAWSTRCCAAPVCAPAATRARTCSR